MRASIIIVGLLVLTGLGCQTGQFAMGTIAMRNPYRYNLGVDGPGPGVVPGNYSAAMMPLGGNPAGVVQAGFNCDQGMPGMGMGPGMGMPSMGPMGGQPSQIEFLGPDGLTVQWDVSMPGAFDSTPLFLPGRHGFQQGAIYRLKLANIASQPGRELYPTLEVSPVTARTAGFLQHSAVPVEFTDNDFDQVLSGNYITKVVYLPKPEFQGFATAGIGVLVNTQLEPGVDPVQEASNRGSILAIIRMGNKDLSQVGGSPMDGGMMGGMSMSGTPFRQNYISGVTGPEYGIPMTGTSSGYPGPPSLPLAPPAQRGGVIGYTMPQ